MIERAFILVVFALLAGGAIGFIRLMLVRRKSRAERDGGVPAEFAGLAQHTPIVLAFSSVGCRQCKRLQKPALSELQRLRQSAEQPLQVIEINAAERSDLTARYGILSVPATVILKPDRSGPRVAAVNYNFTDSTTLLKQLA